MLTLGLLWGTPLCAQQTYEFGIQAMATASNPAVGVGGLYGGLRTSNRTRLSAAAGIGGSNGELAFRGELLGHFLLSPNKRTGTAPYFAAGVAAVAGRVERGYLVLTLGVEQRPGAGSGWAAEAGIGGGFRVALGYRWRRHNSVQLP